MSEGLISFLYFLSFKRQLLQKTPVRVLHRRSLLSRPRYIYSLSTCLLNRHYFLLSVITSAGLIELRFKILIFIGTYVKEFVHGDFGRTTPNVSSLLQANVREINCCNYLNE